MGIQFFNTMIGKKESFEPRVPGKVGMYHCGPTVYDYAHIGNFRSFLFADLLRRYLEYRGYEVTQVMNLTDVGHIRDDADEGEDKVEARARQEKLDPWALAEKFIGYFFEDLDVLGVQRAHVYPRATEHIPEMIGQIQRLLEKGHAYEVAGAVYYDVTTFPHYGALSGNTLDSLRAGHRIDPHPDKRNPFDFALWKSDPHHIMKWASPWGPHGFPGWHIECSAMGMKYLGESFDIHTGGEDNIFPHHECEIAQSECHTGEPFARYWMHAKFLKVDGGKMAKSLGNVYTLDDVAERGFEIRVLRYALIRGHYRRPLNFTWDIMTESRSALENLDDLVLRLRRRAGDAAPAEGSSPAREAREGFEAGLNDDLNMPEALAALFELRNRVMQDEPDPAAAAEALAFVLRANEVLGVMRTEEETVDAGVEALIEARTAARAAKDWAESDRIRDELLKRGIVLEDTPEGTVWRKK